MTSTHNKKETVSLKKRAAKGALWITIETVGVQLASFVVFATIAHFIEPKDFGLISISFLAIQSMQVLILYNVTTVVMRKSTPTDLEYTTTFWLMVGFSLLAFFIIRVSANGLEWIFSASGLTPILRSMSTIILFMGLAQTHESWLIRHFHFKSMAIRGLVGAIAGGSMGVLLAIKGYGVNALIVQQITASLASIILLWIVCPWRPSFGFSRATAIEILNFMHTIWGNSFVNMLNQNCDTFLVAFFFGPTNAGVFNVGKRIRLTLNLVAGTPIRGISLPILAEMQTDADRLHRGIMRSLTLICAVCSPIFFGTSAVAHEAISVVFGQKWMDAVPVLQLLSFSGFAMILVNYAENIFILNDRQSWSIYASLTYATLAVAAVTFCIKLEVHSLALPFILPYIIVLPLSAVLVSKLTRLRWRDWGKVMMPGIVCATIMYIAVRLTESALLNISDLERLVVMCLIGVVTYVFCLWLLWKEVVHMLLDVAAQVLRK